MSGRELATWIVCGLSALAGLGFLVCLGTCIYQAIAWPGR